MASVNLREDTEDSLRDHKTIAEWLNKTQIIEEIHEAQILELFFKISEYVYFIEA